MIMEDKKRYILKVYQLINIYILINKINIYIFLKYINIQELF